jgi:hypothetical protein
MWGAGPHALVIRLGTPSPIALRRFAILTTHSSITECEDPAISAIGITIWMPPASSIKAASNACAIASVTQPFLTMLTKAARALFLHSRETAVCCGSRLRVCRLVVKAIAVLLALFLRL